MPLNALTVDVEEHFQVHNFEKVVDRRRWDTYPSRVVASTQRILKLLEEHKTHATFFILGWVAERHPHLVREIARAGHEIGTHGYAHELIYRQKPEEFAADLARSLDAIQAALRQRFAEGSTAPAPPPITADVVGYRAPAFSVTRESLWALDILKDHGIHYDSSIFPVTLHDRYGISDAGRFASRLENGLWEVPVSTLRVGGRNLPVAGGGYFRLSPSWLNKLAIRAINWEGEPAVVYLHPWEFDPEQPRIPGASPLSRFRHYVNLASTEDKLRSLLSSELKFAPIREVFASRMAAAAESRAA
jgi:polysaccharide deacetylase family protein (PEP-CTERM system associated)